MNCSMTFSVDLVVNDQSLVKLWLRIIFISRILVGSVAEWVKTSFLRQPCSHDLGSTPTLVTLLRPWIRRCMMIISSSWLRTSSKFSGQEFEEIHRNIGSLETPKQVRIVNAMKSARIVQHLASDAVRWQKDKSAQQL